MLDRDKADFWMPIYGLIASISVGFLLGVLRQFALAAVDISFSVSALLIMVAWFFIEGILTLFVPYQNSKIWNLANFCALFATYWVVVENFGVGGWGAA
jgi:hypothetical protein